MSTNDEEEKTDAKSTTSEATLEAGSIPLDDKELENMVILRVEGFNQQKAYRTAHKRRIKGKSAKEQASVAFARPDVKDRLTWLMRQKNAQNAPGSPIPAQGKATPPGKAPRKADLALAQRKASEALYLAETPADIVKAVAACRELGLIDTAEQAKADPTLVLQAILSYAGRTGAEICEQLGGLAFMLDKFLTVCKVTPDDLRATLAQRYPPAEPQPEPGE